MSEADRIITVQYTNWRGETTVRRIIPQWIGWMSNQWHPEPQWLMEAFDVEKGALLTFAWRDMRVLRWPHEPPKVGGPGGPSIYEAIDAIRAAGGDAWDKIGDPAAYLGRSDDEGPADAPAGGVSSHGYTLPPGFYAYDGPCGQCGKPKVVVDRVEGLRIYQCPDGCGAEEAS